MHRSGCDHQVNIMLILEPLTICPCVGVCVSTVLMASWIKALIGGVSALLMIALMVVLVVVLVVHRRSHTGRVQIDDMELHLLAAFDIQNEDLQVFTCQTWQHLH